MADQVQGHRVETVWRPRSAAGASRTAPADPLPKFVGQPRAAGLEFAGPSASRWAPEASSRLPSVSATMPALNRCAPTPIARRRSAVSARLAQGAVDRGGQERAQLAVGSASSFSSRFAPSRSRISPSSVAGSIPCARSSPLAPAKKPQLAHHRVGAAGQVATAWSMMPARASDRGSARRSGRRPIAQCRSDAGRPHPPRRDRLRCRRSGPDVDDRIGGGQDRGAEFAGAVGELGGTITGPLPSRRRGCPIRMRVGALPNRRSRCRC